MAKATASAKKQNRIDVQNISERDRDILSLDTATAMKKYKMEKQGVYDRRFALNKKLKAAGLTLDQVLTETPDAEQPVKKRQPKKARAKKVRPEKVEVPVEETAPMSRELMVVNKQVPVIFKPIEINFDNFSIRLNGVPKKISVNPDTNAIEIDL